MGIGSVNDVPAATSSYARQRDDETTQLRSELQATQAQLGSLESFLDVLAVGNPQLEMMLQHRREQLGIPHPQTQSQPQSSRQGEDDEELARRSEDFVRQFHDEHP